MQQQSIQYAITTDDLLVDLCKSGECEKMTFHDFVLLAEQVAATVGVCGLVHFIA